MKRERLVSIVALAQASLVVLAGCGGEDGGGGGVDGGGAAAAGIPLTGAEHIAMGESHTCAVASGAVYCWGGVDYGQLGYFVPAENSSKLAAAVPGLETGVTALRSQQSHNCVVQGGKLRCWGRNLLDQLGATTGACWPGVPVACSEEPVDAPVASAALEAFAVGANHTCASVTGVVSCWGSNQYGQLGPDLQGMSSAKPVAVTDLPGAPSALAAGPVHTCAIVGGGLHCWGALTLLDAQGQLVAMSPDPVPVPGLESGVTSVAAGYHTCAVKDGAAWCWGANQDGQVGDGTTEPALRPVAVKGLPGPVESLAAGADHTCAVVDGSVYCWGANERGELGDGTTASRSTPVAVQGLPGRASALAVDGPSSSHGRSCAIVEGEIWCWGSNLAGLLGDGRHGFEASSAVPVRVLKGLAD
jgi:alpha-tubulin suppressor-like RCC1 family protein